MRTPKLDFGLIFLGAAATGNRARVHGRDIAAQCPILTAEKTPRRPEFVGCISDQVDGARGWLLSSLADASNGVGCCTIPLIMTQISDSLVRGHGKLLAFTHSHSQKRCGWMWIYTHTHKDGQREDYGCPVRLTCPPKVPKVTRGQVGRGFSTCTCLACESETPDGAHGTVNIQDGSWFLQNSD